MWSTVMIVALCASACVCAYIAGHSAGWKAGEVYAWVAIRGRLRSLHAYAQQMQADYGRLEKQYTKLLGARGRAGRVANECN